MAAQNNETTVFGTFTIPIDDEKQSDPSERPYMAPPMPKSTESITFPLTDFRTCVFDNDDAQDWSKGRVFLRSHGFTAVKHSSALLQNSDSRHLFNDASAVAESYYPEVTSLIKTLTSCRTVFVTNSYIRGGPKFKRENGTEAEAKPTYKPLDPEQPVHTLGASPARFPHLDYTPLGARQAIRHWRPDISAAAQSAGVIEAEDRICAKRGVRADDKASDAVIDCEYNNPMPGPRYAAYSIWRPLRTVTRDPLAMIPRRNLCEEQDLVCWPYDIRVPGLDGDWTRELEMVKLAKLANVNNEVLARQKSAAEWFYLSQQRCDEALVVKFFDSAALGEGVEEAAGAPHGSPDVGDAGFGEERESVEVRVVVFW